MLIKSILNRVQSRSGIVYEAAHWRQFRGRMVLEIQVGPWRRSRPICSGCGPEKVDPGEKERAIAACLNSKEGVRLCRRCRGVPCFRAIRIIFRVSGAVLLVDVASDHPAGIVGRTAARAGNRRAPAPE